MKRVFAVLRYEGDRKTLLKTFGDDKEAAIAYGAQAAEETPDATVTCVRAYCNALGRIAADQLEVFREWPAKEPEVKAAPRPSVVRVSFPGRSELAYFNDRFDLHEGDRVYVEGALKGIMGRVTAVNYAFKIKLDQYKRVIAQVDTRVRGEFHLAGTRVLTFDPNAIPAWKVRDWFLPPEEEGGCAVGTDDSVLDLADAKTWGMTPAIEARGESYFRENRVVYLSLEGAKGYAIVRGTEYYEVEFTYENGQVHSPVCTCLCTYPCKHIAAALFLLRQTLDLLEKSYKERYAQSGYLAVMQKDTLLTVAVTEQNTGSFTL